MSQQRSTLDGLPKDFVKSLRVLFDMLDDSKTGYVKLTDIASYWDAEAVTGLPPGIMEALKKVTPANGQLSFERFVAGLKIALLRLKSEKVAPSKSTLPHSVSQPDLIPSNQQSATEEQALPHSYRRAPANQMNNGSRTKSLPRLAAWEVDRPVEPAELTDRDVARPEPQHPWYHPTTWKNQREEPTLRRKSGTSDGQYYNDRRPGDGRSSISTAAALKQYSNNDFDSPSKAKRREPRRHTLANGVDYNMIKRMKQLEAERDILLQGYEAVEAAKEWYQQNLSNVEQRMKYVAQPTAHGEHSVEANQERISFQTTRILEVNQQLRALLDSSKKGFPFHMHLAVSQSSMERNETEKDNTIAMLKAQNKMLTKEVSNKSDHIGKVEREKNQLLKDMFQGRNHHQQQMHGHDEYDDTTFI